MRGNQQTADLNHADLSDTIQTGGCHGTTIKIHNRYLTLLSSSMLVVSVFTVGAMFRPRIGRLIRHSALSHW